jgi:hypothetical protein
VAYGAGHLDEAKMAVEKAIAAGHQGLRLLHGKILAELRLSAEAKKEFDFLLADSPEDESLIAQLLFLEEDLKDWNAAFTHASLLTAKYPEDASLQGRLARILVQVGKKAEATQIFIKQAAQAIKENKIEAVLVIFEQILAYEPDHLEILKKRAEFNLKLGKKQETINAYKQYQAVLTQKKMSEEARKVAMIVNKLSGFK